MSLWDAVLLLNSVGWKVVPTGLGYWAEFGFYSGEINEPEIIRTAECVKNVQDKFRRKVQA